MGKKKENVKVEKKVKAKPAAPKKAPARKTVKKTATRTVTPEERQKMIEQAAYFRAERFGFQVDPAENWLAAEAEVEAILARKK